MNAEEINKIIELEGDYEEFTYISSNNMSFKCVIKRNESLKHLLGYVHITDSNKFYKTEGYALDVHGGITYTEQEGESWVFGFDCAHYGDYIPNMFKFEMFPNNDDVYRDKDYVTSELNKLCEQLSW